MADLAAFLPPHLVGSLASHGRVGELPCAERMDAALLFSDISGFTALTERLESRGREGAEEIAALVNRAFEPAIAAIEVRDGSIASFGGDALFALFSGSAAVMRAEAAASDIRDGFARLGSIGTSAGAVSLQVAQAIHSGTVTATHLGTASRCHYLLLGDAVLELARLQGVSVAGDIVLSEEAQRLRRVGERKTPRPRPLLVVPNEILKPYLPPPLIGYLGRFEGEYRPVCLMFLETNEQDLEALQSFFQRLCEGLDAHDGVLLKSDLSASGTKWLCAFGLPKTHEDDADRAARAFLALRQSLAPGFPVRAGLAAGTVVALEMGSRLRRCLDVMGDVVNTAARALAEADWGEALLTSATRERAVSVETAPRGSRAVKGKAAPLLLYSLKASRSRAGSVRVMAPLAGREQEMKTLRDALERARRGEASIIGIQGESGLGKSRLRWEVARAAAEMGLLVHEGGARAFGGSAYGPVAELLRSMLDLPHGTNAAETQARVHRRANELGLSEGDSHHLADVLHARSSPSPLDQLDAKAIRLNNAIAVRRYLGAESKQAPRLFALEDMHWADELSRGVVESIALDPTGPFLLLLLYRPGYEPPKGTAELRLAEISGVAVGEMLRSLLGSGGARLAPFIQERAEGNPLYVEELVRHLVETGVLVEDEGALRQALPPVATDVPGRLEAVIAARIDRLTPDARRVAQVGAVLGRRFSPDLLEQVEGAGSELAASLRELSLREIVLEASRAGRRECVFKHALMRDVAYGTILVSRRRELHRKAAEVMEGSASSPELALLAHHWEQGDAPERARPCYLAAARFSASRYAHQEAESLYGKYLSLTLEPSVERIRARIELSEEVLKIAGKYARAIDEGQKACEDAQHVGDRALEGRAVGALAALHWLVGSVDEARAEAERALAAVREAGDRMNEGQILGNLANIHEDKGRIEEARALREQAIAIHREVGDRRILGITLGNLANLNANQGKFDEARDLYAQAIAIHREIGNRRMEGICLGYVAGLHHRLGRLDDALPLYQEAISIHREVGDRQFLGVALGNLGGLHHQKGQTREARDLYEQALAIYRDVGNRTIEGIVLVNLASLAVEEGRLKEALLLHERALAIHRAAGNRVYEAVAYVNLASLYVDLGRPEEAQGLFEQALDIDVQLSNEPYEAMTLSSLGSLHADQGRPELGLPMLDRALAMEREIGNRGEEAVVMANIASAKLRAGQSGEATALLEGALALLDQGSQAKPRAFVLLLMARTMRLHGADLESAGRLLAEARGLLSAANARVELAKCDAEEGLLARASGRDAADYIVRVRAVVEEYGIGPNSPLGRALAELESGK